MEVRIYPFLQSKADSPFLHSLATGRGAKMQLGKDLVSVNQGSESNPVLCLNTYWHFVLRVRLLFTSKTIFRTLKSEILA